jgi:hypothetical protein
MSDVPQEVKGARHDALLEDDGTANAVNVNYSNFVSGLSSTNVQDAIDEISAGGGGGGSSLTYVPVMVNSPAIVTTDGLPVYVPLTTVDGEAIMVAVTL